MNGVDRIFEILEERKISQKDFAEAIGVRPATVSDWKRRNNSPTIKKYCEIAEYLNVSLDYLLTGKEYIGGEKNFNQNGNQIISGQSSEITNSFNGDKDLTQLESLMLFSFRKLSDNARNDVLQYCAMLASFDKDVFGGKRCLQYANLFRDVISDNPAFWELSLLLKASTENEIKFLSNILKIELEKRGVDCAYYLSKERLDMIQPK